MNYISNKTVLRKWKQKKCLLRMRKIQFQIFKTCNEDVGLEEFDTYKTLKLRVTEENSDLTNLFKWLANQKKKRSMLRATENRKLWRDIVHKSSSTYGIQIIVCIIIFSKMYYHS